ncbi:MAG: nitrous oxide-stimulated promoter family protein [Armatimonadota bacterium]
MRSEKANEAKGEARRRRRVRRSERAVARELGVLQRFVDVYCRAHHSPADGQPCAECRDLIQYASKRLQKCPYDPKPKCKDCPTHCYRPDYRQRVREVMRFSGKFFVKRGRLDWLVRYFM